MKQKNCRVLLQAMRLERDRAMNGLASRKHPKPYFVSYLVRSTEKHNVWGRYGAVWHEATSEKRQCYADIRVGSYVFDHVPNGGLDDNCDEAESFDMIDLPLECESDAVRFSLWRLTDARYREAVADYYAKKSRDLSFINLNKGTRSFIKLAPETSHKRLQTFSPPKEQHRKLVRRLSEVFKPFPEIKNSYVELTTRLQTKLFVSSEGVERVWQEPVVELVAYFWLLGRKNEDQGMTLSFMAHDSSQLPSEKRLEEALRERIQVTYKLDRAKILNSYAGPVLLSAKAAGLFLHEAVGHRLESNRFLADDEARAFKDKLQKRIMHPDLSIVDDPTVRSWKGQPLVGAYTFDDEGVPSQRATLVEKGVLKGFLASRSPYKRGQHRSNGHARSQGYERPISRMGNLLVRSHSSKSWEVLKEEMCEELRRRNLPFGVILYEVEGGETGTDAYDFQAFLGEITIASQIFPSGRERYIKGVDFVGTPLSSLNQILAVGCELSLDNGHCGAESGLIPVSTVAPPLLMSNLELQAKAPTKVTNYRLPLPWFESPSSK